MFTGTARCSGIHTDSYPRASAFCATWTNSSGRAVEPLPTPVTANFIVPPLYLSRWTLFLLPYPKPFLPATQVPKFPGKREAWMEFLKVSPIEGFPVEVEGETGFYILDPLNYPKNKMVVSSPVFFFLSHSAGRHSPLDVREAFPRQFGQVLA